ncbi:MAG TPA: hypothetical protein VLA89_07445 [Gemmatimonadales bacterium]|nr:hypothetical protein [Gemmatimonadales bacterium]
MTRLRALLFLGIMVIGCASTRMTSVIDPAGEGKQYQRLIVWAKVADRNTRGRMERQVVQRLEEAGAEGASSLDLLPPTREYSESEITTVLWARGMEGFLILSWNESAASHVSTSAGTDAGGGTRSWASLQCELFDVLYQRRVWSATARTKERDGATFESVAPYCDRIVERMVADGLISRTGRQSLSPKSDSAER